MAQYNIFTDGACANNGAENARAGWGIIICDENFEQLHTAKGKVTGTQTNNRAELSAILSAFQWIKENTTEGDQVTIYCDSEICIKMMTGECNRIKNRDIWDTLENICDNIVNKIALSAVHVAAHKNDYDNIASRINNECDKLARSASRALF